MVPVGIILGVQTRNIQDNRIIWGPELEYRELEIEMKFEPLLKSKTSLKISIKLTLKHELYIIKKLHRIKLPQLLLESLKT